ncbi:MAG: EamA family transporter [Anaerolineales bacterium]|nr:MAG: EamA family transporter [Anaerolineales bacterium]
MSNAFLYVITVLIWGSTWLAIKLQLGTVAPELSVAYRFLLAALILFVYSKWRGLNLRFSRSQHAFMALQGLMLFSLNYVMVYFSETYVTSGLVAVLFSAVIILNVMFGAIFLRNAVQGRVVAGALVGVVGVALIFWPELRGLQVDSLRALGIGLGLCAAVSASLGNIVSARNQRANLPVIQTNAYGMLYGSLATLAFAVLRGTQFTFELSAGYLGSLLYLALFGSVIAFGSYLTLLGRIGADRVAYVNVFVPVIALALSAIFEGLHLGWFEFTGVALVLLGNAIVVGSKRLKASA